MIGTAEKTSIKRGVLSTKLTNYERWKISKLYKEHQGLVRKFGGKLITEYPSVSPDEIFSCINIAFIKAVRTFDSDKGKFSTIFYKFAKGEVSHHLRTNAYWGYGARPSVRELGLKARRLIAFRNVPMFALPKILGCTKEQLREALESTLHISYTLDNERVSDEEENPEKDIILSEAEKELLGILEQ